MQDTLFQNATFWPAVILAVGSVVLGLKARRQARERHLPLQGRMGRTTLGRLAEPLPGDLDLIAHIGENRRPKETAGTQVLRTTLGLRAISLGLSALILFYMLSGAFAPQGLSPENAVMMWILGGGIAIGILDVLTYELRYDRHGMVLTRFMYWRRSYDWVHLMGIDDDQHYQYVLAFSKGGRVKVMKHLVGIHEFLTLVAKTLDRNEAPHAGTARG
ncbi:MAG: hypothetical protein ACRCS3_13960 [Paracoccaceae bacterium]